MEIAKVELHYGKAIAEFYQKEPTFLVYKNLAGNIAMNTYGGNPFPHGEGTAASIIRKLPPRVLRQMPTGRLRNISNEFMSIMCEFIVECIFFRLMRLEEGDVQSMWNLIENGAVYGWSTITPYFTKVNGAYTVDFKTHYWADVFPAPGTRNINAGDVFIREWWEKEDILALKKQAKEDKTLNSKMLDMLLAGKKSSRMANEQTVQNERAAVQNLGYEVIKYYVREKGKYMLYVYQQNAPDFIQKKELPTRGHVTFYYDHDDETAYGRSVLSLIGGIQIDLDQSQQSRRKAEQLEVDPMVILKNWALSKAQVQPGTLLTLPGDATFETFKLDTPSLLNYNANHSANQALIYNLVGYPEANVSGGMSGASDIGKTPTAIKQAQGNIEAADNKVQWNLKLFLEQFASEALKIYFHNLPEAFLVEVSQEYEERIRAVAPERIIEDGVVLVNNELDLFDYEIDIETSTNDVNALKLDSIMKFMGAISQIPLFEQRMASLGMIDPLLKEMALASGFQNDTLIKRLAALDSPNMMNPNPATDPFYGQPIPPEVAMQMQAAGGGGQAPPPPGMQVNTQAPNPVRQQGVM